MTENSLVRRLTFVSSHQASLTVRTSILLMSFRFKMPWDNFGLDYSRTKSALLILRIAWQEQRLITAKLLWLVYFFHVSAEECLFVKL